MIGRVLRGALGAAALAALGGCAAGAAPATRPAARPAAAPGAPTADPAEVKAAAIPRYVAADERYLVTQADSLTLSYPSGTQRQILQHQSALRLVLREAPAGGFTVSIRLDSVRAVELPRDSLLAGDGLLWTGRLGADGRLGALTASKPVPLAEQLVRPALAALFLPLPEGGVRPGAAWRDSVVQPRRLLNLDVQETAVTDRSALPALDGVRVTGSAALTAAGKGAAFGQELELAAAGVRREAHELVLPGVVATATRRDSLAVEVSVPSVGQTVPATRISTLLLERVRR